MSVPVEVLRRAPLLAGVSDDDVAALAGRFQERAYDRGAPVFSRGGTGDGFFIIAEGEATVMKGGVAASRLKKHDCFGEIALIDGGRRSADIVAETNMRCWGISRNEFRTFVKGHPEVAWALLETLATRLRTADKPVAPVRERRRWLRRHGHGRDRAGHA
jgi:CRP-like cAMP-binding protein